MRRSYGEIGGPAESPSRSVERNKACFFGKLSIRLGRLSFNRVSTDDEEVGNKARGTTARAERFVVRDPLLGAKKTVRLLRTVEAIEQECQGGIVAVGNFDGVHAGHRSIVDAMNTMAARLGGPSVVFTFDPHPLHLLRPESAPMPLSWPERKAQLLGDLGVDVLLAYPTSRELLELDYEQFFTDVIVGKLQAKGMVEGPNFFFGKDRQGNVSKLADLCARDKLELEIVELQGKSDQVISSSRIRKMVADGAVDDANQLLTSPYRIRGRVEKGDQRGRVLGFPTANLVDCPVLIPAFGVYAGWVVLGVERIPAAVHIGPNPTFGVDEAKIEAHLLDWNRDLYGQWIEIEFGGRVRGTQTFDSADALKDQLRRDVDEVRARTTTGR